MKINVWLKWTPLLLAAWLSMAGACVAPYVISDAQEREMGEAIVADLEADPEFHLLNDPEIDAYLTQLSMPIIENSPYQRSFPFTFKAVINDEVNAFALPGGFCYVHTGLIRAAETEAELVGVIAHEVSHVTCGHHRNAMTNEMLIQTAEGLVFNEQSPMIAVYASQIASGLGMLRYSRTQEAQADEVGVIAMSGAGWNPTGLESFFERLQGMEGSDPGRFEMWFRSHPATSDRIQAIDTQIQNLPNANSMRSDSPQFHFMQDRVNELLGD